MLSGRGSRNVRRMVLDAEKNLMNSSKKTRRCLKLQRKVLMDCQKQ